MKNESSVHLKAQGFAEEPKKAPSDVSRMRTLPILGLSDIVVFPGMTVPLLVESQQSIRLVDEVVSGDRMIGLILQKRADTDNPLPEELWERGCLAKVNRMLKFPDNSVRILIEGLTRFRVMSYEKLDPFFVAQIELLVDENSINNKVVALARNAKRTFDRLLEISLAVPDDIKVALLNTEDPGRVADIIAPHSSISLGEKQQLLEVEKSEDRLGLLIPMLVRELELATLGSKIQKDVADSLSKNQREFYLREQLRTIRKELGEDPTLSELEVLTQKVRETKLPNEVMAVVTKELERLRHIPPQVAEHSISRAYIDWILDLPWMETTEDRYDLKLAESIFDNHHYGLQKVKDRLLDYLAVLEMNRQMKGPILCLVGPPGVGKTSFVQSVASALGRKFGSIALGGMRDEAEIRGHRRTYVGAMPGRLVQLLRRLKSKNPVILLDEIDKVGMDVRGDPSAALLEVLDPAQNTAFTDHYLDVPFDLSQILFLATANWLEPVYPALRDRLELIEIPSYTRNEKIHIAEKHLIPRQLKEHGLGPKKIKVGTSTLDRLIAGYTQEAGVRGLERTIATVVRKCVRKMITISNSPRSMTVLPEDLEGLLGIEKFVRDDLFLQSEVGVANGLAWTPVGGEILPIEVTASPGNGKITMTGSLGDIMKESVQIAISVVRGMTPIGNDLPDRLSEFSKLDLHVHAPSGAVPKDGPSAGITLAVALASFRFGIPVPSGFALTGEISLRGKILRVGGIKEKSMAAQRYGMKSIIIPKSNIPEWREVPAEVRKKLKVHFASEISEIIRLLLSPPSTQLRKRRPRS